MREIFFLTLFSVLFAFMLHQGGVFESISKTSKKVQQFEYKALALAKANRLLVIEKKELEAKIAHLEAKNEHLLLEKADKKRTIASIPKKRVDDLVNFKVYKWSAEKLLGVGEKALHFKKYKKSAQFYNALINEYPKNNLITDRVLFEAGMSAYESGEYYPWAKTHFKELISKYPTSKYYRGAKLWLALTFYQEGDTKSFMNTVEDFRLKYRNTKEWKILSPYYEELAHKYGRQ